MARMWGYWTRGKLDVLRAYLDAFSTATKSAGARIYIDAFAGSADNRDRITGERIEGSAEVALSVDSPPFTRLLFFETAKEAKALERSLRTKYPNRHFTVHEGDCNVWIPQALARIAHISHAPTFAFVDPNALEATWSLLVSLADFRRRRRTKVELFYLFTSPMFSRLLQVDVTDIPERHIDTIDAIFGCHDWWDVYQARKRGEIAPSRARDEYLNLMRWRLERELGYKWTHPLPVHNERGNLLYHMIFATDSEVGTKIMSHLYAKAAGEFPEMRERARRMRTDQKRREHGVAQLFDDTQLRTPPRPGERFYEHEPPWPPRYGSGRPAVCVERPER